MQIDSAPQGSGAWLAARSGIITASNFSQILTPSTLKPSKQLESIALQVAAARVFGVFEDTICTPAMERGSELEAEARAAYSLLTGCNMEEVGLCINDAGTAGASPDGLVGMFTDDASTEECCKGGLEIKCPKLAKHLSTLDSGKVPAEHRLQIQGGLWITGAAWWDFMSYYPGLPELIIRVLPDDTVFAALEAAVGIFTKTMQEKVEKLEALK